MNPAIVLVAAILFITIIVLWLLLRPLLARRSAKSVAAGQGTAADGGTTNVDALRVELAEARRDHQLGLLTANGLAEAERELESRVLAEAEVERVVNAGRYPRTAVALGVTVPLLAIGSYLLIGSPAAAIPDVVRPVAASTGAGGGGQNAEQQMDELFRMAEERLKQNPGDVKGWLLLARAKSSVGRFAEALQAYEKATALAADDADVWADYADAAAGQAQGKIDGQPITLVNKALAIDPRNPKALLLKGTWEIQQNQFAAAEKTFSLARSLVEPSSGFAQIADNALADIKSRGSGSSGSGAEAAANSAPLATVQLQLSAEARKAAGASAAVFLIVRAAGVDRGPPLAAKRIDVGSLDKPVLLSAADAMIGGAGLKDGAEVTLQARLSLNGQPTAQNGDWQSQKTSAKLPATSTLSIDQRIGQ